MKNSYITVTDQFCGAGGSSQGARRALEPLGGEVKLAMNHWKLAIETHNTNFPNTLHDCTDISACDPRRYPGTTILITSPECTNHSLAKGQKQVKAQLDLFEKGVLDPAAERSRATMWDVVRFAEYHRYEAIIVENVVDARKWVMFDSWLMAMHALGYMHKAVYLNSRHMHPTPQSRDRMYVVFWKKANTAPDLEYKPKAYCQCCGKDVDAIQSWKNPAKQFGKYRQQYVYRCPVDGSIVEPYYYAAFNCIDWSDIGTKIGNRSKPLSENTIRRIKHGLDKYGDQRLMISNYSPGYSARLSKPVGTVTTRNHHAILTPFLVNDQQTTGVDCRVKRVDDHLPTIATNHSLKLIMPFVVKGEHSLNEKNAQAVSGVFQTQTTRQSMALVTPPMIVEMNRTGKAKPSTEPTSTFTAGGVNHAVVSMPILVENKGQSLSKPITEPAGYITTKPHLGIISSEAWNSFIHYNYSSDTLSHVSDPLGTVTTKDRHSVISYDKPQLEDCYYRMLKANEIKLAMAFEHDYIVLGNQRDQVKLLGNAVTPPAMEWLVGQIVKSLE